MQKILEFHLSSIITKVLEALLIKSLVYQVEFNVITQEPVVVKLGQGELYVAHLPGNVSQKISRIIEE